MIKLELHNDPGYPTTNPKYYGTIHHSRFGVTGYGVSASVNCDYRSTLEVRRYLCGLEPPNFPVPAIAETCTIWHNRVIFSRYKLEHAFKSGYLSEIIYKN